MTDERKKSEKKDLAIKIVTWIAQVAFIILVTSPIENQYVALVVAILGGMLITFVIKKIANRKKKEDAPESEVDELSDPNEEIYEEVINSWNFCPDILKERITELGLGAVSDKIEKRKLKKNMELTKELFKAKDLIREKQHEDAKITLDYIKNQAKRYKLEILVREADYYLAQIPEINVC